MGCNSRNIGSHFPTVNHNNPCLDTCSQLCPDFTIRRHDTRPNFKVGIEDCDGAMDFTDLVVEFSMWAKGRLKTALTTTSSFLSFADKIGFDQVMVGDILVLDRARSPEHMKVLGFDEDNYLVYVQRGVNGTTVSSWKRGTGLRIMKAFSNPAASEMIYEDVSNLDGTIDRDQLRDSFLVYSWLPSDTCLAGCYYCEFKLLSLTATDTEPAVDLTGDVTFTMTLTPSQYGCKLGEGVEWVRRFPVSGEGYLIKVEDSCTAEL